MNTFVGCPNPNFSLKKYTQSQRKILAATAFVFNKTRNPYNIMILPLNNKTTGECIRNLKTNTKFV